MTTKDVKIEAKPSFVTARKGDRRHVNSLCRYIASKTMLVFQCARCIESFFILRLKKHSKIWLMVILNVLCGY